MVHNPYQCWGKLYYDEGKRTLAELNESDEVKPSWGTHPIPDKNE